MEKPVLTGSISRGSRNKREAQRGAVATANASNASKGKPLENISSVTTTASTASSPLTTVHKPAVTGHKIKSNHTKKDEYMHESVSESSEEDIEFDEEVVRKILERKIEQAPAAKVIVSEAMMTKALSEMSARKSGICTTAKSSDQSMVSAFSNQRDSGDGNPITTAAVISSPSVSVSKAKILRRKSGERTKGRGDGDAPIATPFISEPTSAMNIRNKMDETGSKMTSGFEIGEEADSSGCPLEKILEFLQAVMTKDYKRALVLAKEVEEHEPNNELVSEYMTVLEKIIHKEEENDNEKDSDSYTDKSSSVDDVEYTEELTTSSETDSISEDEDSESSSTESRSSSSTSGRESNEDEESRHDKHEMTESESNKHEVNVTVEKKEDVNVIEKGVDADGGDISGKDETDVQSKDNENHMNTTAGKVL